MNKCDMDEVKALAVQKFMELAAEPDEWVKSYSYGSDVELVRGKYKITCYDYKGVDSSFHLRIGDEHLEVPTPPRPVWKYKKDGEMTVASKKSRDKWFEDCKKTPFHLAATAIFKKHHDDVECEKYRLKMIKNMEESCKKIKDALVEPLTPKPATRYSEPLAYQHPPWWKFW